VDRTGTSPSFGVFILFMERQWPATRLTLANLRAVLPVNAKVAILLNGAESEAIRAEAAKLFPEFALHESAKNLGVAGGRNFLLNTEEARSADFIFQLDNDVLIPKSYFEKLLEVYRSIDNPGVIGPLVFRATDSALAIYDSIDDPEFPFSFDSRDVIESWKNSDTPKPWHFGTDPNWQRVYCSTLHTCRQLAADLFSSIERRSDNQMTNPRSLQAIRDGKPVLPASNVVGAATLYSRDLVEQLGGYDASFSPYGLEDADFSVRALKAGFENYIAANVAMLHGTDQRKQDRTVSYYFVRDHAVRGGLLIRRRLLDPGLGRFSELLGFSIFSLLFSLGQSLRYRSLDPLKQTIRGIQDGLSRKPAIGKPDFELPS
jgi:GT2 family glycosyltransferase